MDREVPIDPLKYYHIINVETGSALYISSNSNDFE